MDAFLSAFFAWAGPNVIAALVTATIAHWLFGGRPPAPPGRQRVPLVFVAGAAVVVVLAVSVVAAMLAIDPVLPPGSMGIVSGIVIARLAAGASRT
jgi:hypothetical protein